MDLSASFGAFLYERYEKLDLIGSGAYGIVYKVKDKNTSVGVFHGPVQGPIFGLDRTPDRSKTSVRDSVRTVRSNPRTGPVRTDPKNENALK